MVQGLATFPGLGQMQSCDFTLSHGITPSLATVTVAPQPGYVPEVGPLSFSFGSTRFSFRDCKIDANSYARGRNGQTWTLQIMDRRWKWRYGEIEGSYNLRGADGKVIADTKKTPQELAKLLLEAMGEDDFDVSELPNDTNPEVIWGNEAAATVPAQELDALVNSLGCRVALTGRDTVKLVKEGQGAELPPGPYRMEDSTSIDLPEAPDKLKLRAAETKYQLRFTLEAVGIETKANDHKIVPIGKLSYKPAAGWLEPPFLELDDDEQFDLANQSVYRMYRIKNVAGKTDGPLKIPGFDGAEIPPEELSRLLPLKTELLELFEDPKDDDRKAPLQARVFGLWYSLDDVSDEVTEGREYKQQFSLDAELGIVTFSTPVYRLNANAVAEAELVLECVVNVRTKKDGPFDRLTKEKETGLNNGTEPLVFSQPDVQRTVKVVYGTGADYKKQTDIEDNEQEMLQAAEFYLSAKLDTYQRKAAQTRVYAGLLPIDPSGAVHQVTWSVGTQGATTRASYNDEHSIAVPDYKVRRAQQLQGQILAAQPAVKAAQRKFARRFNGPRNQQVI